MAVLRGFKGMTVQENNIVQTVASAAGTLSSVIFVLPGMVIIGWWTGFPYWVSCAICGLGGILGVMYSIPLRRALVTQSDLPYPEGVACAEVLKVGGGEHANAAAVEDSRAGLAAVVWGAIVSAAFACIVATRIFASDVARYFRVGDRGGVTGFDFLLSFALFAVGHLVGLWVGIAMFVGALIGWAWGVPHFSALAAGSEPMAQLAQHTWSHQVRFVGAGTIGWRRCGRWRSSSDRWSPGCAPPWRPRGRAPPGTPHCCRAPSRTSRSAMSPWSRWPAWCRSAR
jgi:putative OPT family oligopeptide transporter